MCISVLRVLQNAQSNFKSNIPPVREIAESQLDNAIAQLEINPDASSMYLEEIEDEEISDDL